MFETPTTEAVEQSRSRLYADTVQRVRDAVAAHDVVVVGMAWNQPVRQVRAALDERGIGYHYLEIGNYVQGWRERLAVKLWAGWPTFPQVWVKGTFVGGNSDTRRALSDGTFAALQQGSRAWP